MWRCTGQGSRTNLIYTMPCIQEARSHSLVPSSKPLSTRDKWRFTVDQSCSKFCEEEDPVREAKRRIYFVFLMTAATPTRSIRQWQRHLDVCENWWIWQVSYIQHLQKGWCIWSIWMEKPACNVCIWDWSHPPLMGLLEGDIPLLHRLTRRNQTLPRSTNDVPTVGAYK